MAPEQPQAPKGTNVDGTDEPRERSPLERLIQSTKRVLKSAGSFLVELKHVRGAARVDVWGRIVLFIPALASVVIITLILSLLMYESAPILLSPEGGPGILVNPIWAPNQGQFGILIFIAGTFMCSGLAIVIAIPLGVGGAIFLSEFCPHRLRTPLRMVVQLMAAIPSIVYGLWAFTSLRFWVAGVGEAFLGINLNGLSLLSGGLILAIMLVPTVVAVSDDALQSVPVTYREASFALGATTSETARKVVLSAALPGVGAAVVLSLGRAVGETMAVLMVTGNSLQIPLTLFDPCYVMTSIITNQLGTAYVEPLWRSALFSVALVLMLMSTMFTITAKLFIRWGMKTRGIK
jgi:phosphate transport system permease protein